MPRGRDDMQVNVAGLRRNIKNLAHNYSDAQVKVREATSNDPWGPSSTLMAEIADLTYNVMAFTEIMQMIWKRLNDHGKNWRHVYKALVLMEYLIKTGSEKVAMQCKENIYAIHTLKDFQYMEEGKDQGLNVREKAKQLVTLLKDDERLKNERARALKAKQRFAQSASAFGSDGALDTPTSPTYPALSESSEWESSGAGGGSAGGGREAELARPLTAGEEELQLQLALAMSREEAEREERRKRSDDVRLQLAISQSQHDFQLQEYLHQKYLRLPSITEETYPDLTKTWLYNECPHTASNRPHNASSGPEDTSVWLNSSEWPHNAGDCSHNTCQPSHNDSNGGQNASEWSYDVNNWPYNSSNVAQSNEHQSASEWYSNASNVPQNATDASECSYNASDWPYSTGFTPQYASSELNTSVWTYNNCNLPQDAKNEQPNDSEWSYYVCHLSQNANSDQQNPSEWFNNACNLPQDAKNEQQNVSEWAYNVCHLLQKANNAPQNVIERSNNAIAVSQNAKNDQKNASAWSNNARDLPYSVNNWACEAISCERSQLPSPNVLLCGSLQCQQQNVQDPEDVPTKRAEPAQQSHLLDLLDVNLSPSNGVSSAGALVDPWGVPSPPQRPDTSGDAWSAVNSPARDPWAPSSAAPPPDPWAPTLPHLTQNKSPVSVLSSPSSSELEQFDALSRRPLNNNHEPDNDPFDLTGLGSQLSPVSTSTGAIKKSPSAFLGENSSLVNLERLLQPAATTPAPPHNPFADSTPHAHPAAASAPAPAPAPRQFAPTQPAKLTINELKQQQMGISFPPAPAPGAGPAMTSVGADPWGLPPAPRTASPWSPQNQRHTPNPFLS